MRLKKGLVIRISGYINAYGGSCIIGIEDPKQHALKALCGSLDDRFEKRKDSSAVFGQTDFQIQIESARAP